MSSPADTSLSVPQVSNTLESSLERVVQELIQDRRRERRWKWVSRFFWAGLIVFLAMLSTLPSGHHGVAVDGPHTALIEIQGEISADSEVNAEQIVGAIKKAFEARAAKAVVLRINSPGGSPVQAGIIYDEIKRLKALHQKKIYAVVEDVCASGAYYIAVAADEIYTDKASIVGSIGVLMDGFGFTGLMQKIGVERRLMTAGENKGIGDPFSPLNEKQRGFTQKMLNQIHAQFIAVVKEGRGDRLRENSETFSGLYWSGQQAVEMGLVDRLGNLDHVAREVIQAEDIIDYTPKENVAERLAKHFGVSVGAGLVHALKDWGGLR
ncbi:MAG: signal peptide peptidase SppA [Burkholderiales bacterium]